jgi:ribosomal protein S18 acetylase RimI-like enzyme
VGRPRRLGHATEPRHLGGRTQRAGLPPPPAPRTQLQVERLHSAQPAPHWYLGYLGTRRDRQGEGLGTQMLQEVLAELDTDRTLAYLESSSERNLPLYKRNSFRIVGELQALGHGPTIWRMWRNPQSPT